MFGSNIPIYIPGQGIPIVPGLELFLKSTQAAATASVNPYPWIILVFAPCSCKNLLIFSTLCLFNVSPPPITYFNLDKSISFICSLVVSASNKVGTPTNTVGLCLINSSWNLDALNVGIKTTSAPQQNASFIDTSKPKPWNIGIIPKILSSLHKSG